MTKKEANKYARECAYAKARADHEGHEYIRPQRPDANTLETLDAIAKTSKRNLRTLHYRMNVITQQMDVIVDFITDLYHENPKYIDYFKIVDYLMGSLIEIEETLKTL